MIESNLPVNQVLRELYDNNEGSSSLPVLKLAPEFDTIRFDAEHISSLASLLLEFLPFLSPDQALEMRSELVGAPTQRRFGTSSDGRFLTISLGIASLHPGSVDHTPDQNSVHVPPLAKLLKLVNELGGTVLMSDFGGTVQRIRCVLPLIDEDTGHRDSGHESILLVEDEEFVRNVTREALELSGYNVVEAIDAEMGIQLFRQYGDKIDLLLTDVVMPGMNGHDLALKLFETSPTLRVIFMSGYTENAITRQGLSDPRLVYLQKPFTLEILTKKVREVLDRSSDSVPVIACITAVEASVTPA